MKIRKLTVAQKVLLLDHIDKWQKMSFCNETTTEPINFELAKKYVRRLYELSALKQPRKIVKILSPLEINNVEIEWRPTSMNDITRDTLCNTIRTSCNSVVNNLIHRSLKRKVYDSVSNIVDAMGNTIDSIIFYDSHGDIIINAIYGASLYTKYYAHYSFFRDILNIKLPEIYNVYEKLALNSFFCLLYENVTYICDKPQYISTQITNNINIFADTRNRVRLHNTSGPAIEWRDNYKQWYIEGIRVDEKIVMKPETQTIEQINNDPREERRRIRIEQYGWLKYLEHSGAKLINSRINERDNQKEQLYEDKRTNRFVCVDPSTGRKYAIAVPHTIKTCLEAQKYLSHGLDKFAIHRS